MKMKFIALCSPNFHYLVLILWPIEWTIARTHLYLRAADVEADRVDDSQHVVLGKVACSVAVEEEERQQQIRSVHVLFRSGVQLVLLAM